MSLSWSNEETFDFIELYRAEPVIWDPKHKLHKDRKKVNDAWKRISASLQIPISDLKKKKETLMTAFRINYKKKQDSIRTGAGDKPIWVYYDVMEAFLKGNYECKNIIEGDRSSPLQQESDVTYKQREQDSETSDNDGSKIEVNDKEIKISVKRRHAVQPPELEKAEKEIANAFTTLNQCLNNKDQKIEDECELYGRLLANKLRKYSEIERQEIMYEIDGLLLNRHRNSIAEYCK